MHITSAPTEHSILFVASQKQITITLIFWPPHVPQYQLSQYRKLCSYEKFSCCEKHGKDDG